MAVKVVHFATVGTKIIALSKTEKSKMNVRAIPLIICCLVACTTSKDYSLSSDANGLLNKCYEFANPTFVFESRCADIDGIDNSTICLGVQVRGNGGFPKDIEEYSSNKDKFDSALFDRLYFEKQRKILFLADEGTKLNIKRVVHHGWGTMGRYWIIRGTIEYRGVQYEVELPSLYLIHNEPFWFDARKEMMPNEGSILNIRACANSQPTT